ncbi:hypothetical protein [Candidatus Magnetaquicoccus inordinatus]|uniref:hypothetical protein n=1 Tax=Candidatus Magnetaquicoccus inordinatus TaxID=2496818 RepID=UPI00102B505D|nr:hypothetical protein [Candidatus Magnetaquicoccus inordinatus]
MSMEASSPDGPTVPQSHELVAKAMGDFQEAMKIRSSLNLRVAMRVTAILRTGMISLAVVAIVFLLLLALVSSKLEFMIGVMNTMNVQFSSMAKDMSVMRQVLEQMDRHVASMPVIVGEVERMNGSVAALHTDIQAIAKRMHQVEANLGGITASVESMTHTFQGMEWTVRGIDGNVQRMSRPMKLFNSFVPFQ